MFSVNYEYKSFVRFIDIDSYKILHHSKYFSILEESRFAFMMDELDISNEQLENCGLMFLVLRLNAKYIKSAVYGDEITVKMKITFKKVAMINFNYVLFNQKGEKLFIGNVDVGYFNVETQRMMIQHPQWITDKIESVYNVKF